MRVRTRRWAGLVLVTPLLVTACGGSGGGSGDGPKAAGRAVNVAGADQSGSGACTTDKVGGSLSYGAYTNPPAFDPAASQANLGAVQLQAVYDTLVRYNYSTSTYEPLVAKSLEASADSKTWTLTLRPEVTFDDGTPLTAEAVKASIARFLQPENAGASTAYVGNIAAMTVQSPTVLVFTLKRAFGSFPYVLATEPGMIVNPRVVAAGSKALDTAAPAAAGVGPYTLQSFAATGDIVLKAKKNWWGGPVCIDTITFSPITDGKTKLDSFKGGQLQAFQTFDSPVLKQLQADRTSYLTFGNPTVSELQLNNKNLPSTKARQAIAYALNLDSVNQRAYDGTAKPISSLIDPDSPLAPSVAAPGYDLTKAKSLLVEAKTEGYDGKVEFLVTQSPLQENLSILEAAMLKAAGFEVERVVLQNADLISRVYINRNYQMALWGTAADAACLWCNVSSWRSDDPSNIGNYSNPGMDAALDELQTANTPDALKVAQGKVQQIWNDTQPSVINGHLPYVVAYSPAVHGLQQNASQQLVFDKAYLTK